jgi:hypothetical protein
MKYDSALYRNIWMREKYNQNVIKNVSEMFERSMKTGSGDFCYMIAFKTSDIMRHNEH